MEQNKVTRILCKLIVGLTFTDIELLTKKEIAETAVAYAKKVDEVIDGDRFVSTCVEMSIIVLENEVNGVRWYRHNLSKTLF
jgi:hypothetical protein